MENVFAGRIEALRERMVQEGWDAVVITGSDPHASEYPAARWKQVQWLCGFTGEAGDVVVTADHAGLWTDTRYFIQAVKQLAGTGVELHKMRVPEQVPIPQWLAGRDVHKVAVDGLCFSVGQVDELKAAVPGVDIVLVPDILSSMWDGRPGVPSTPVITLGEDLCGESREHRLSRLRKWLILNGVDAVLLTALDDIAWVLNVRGSDIDYNPLVISYLFVSLDEVRWYVMKSADSLDSETDASFYELRSDGVDIRYYDDIASDLVSLDGISSLAVDPGSLNAYLYDLLQREGPSLVSAASPVKAWKAVKNKVELDGMRDAHLEDGLAMEKFLFWLEQNAGRVDEWEAACRLQELRAAIPGYRGDSFETISAYGPSAALPHYVTPSSDAPLIEERGLYLVDSGGQYLFGTTDITRTVPMGPCTELEKEDYTLVLKGHIDLAMAVFPAGTAGCQIDALAREPLWRFKRNFGHGTGHGVGFFLCVHEGPHDVRQNFNPVALQPGMILSDEPGIYREGMHGVRHENLVAVRSLGTNDFGSWLGFEVLTLCHIDTGCLVPDLLDRAELDWLNAYNERVFRTLSPRLPADVTAWLRAKTAAVPDC